MTQILNNIDKKVKIRPAFSGWPMVIGWIAMLIFALHACTHMVGAGDTWVAMACGRHFVNHGVDTNEPFSANSHRPGPTKQSMDKYAKLLRSEAGSKKGVKNSLMRWWADKCENYENWPEWKKSFVHWIHPTGWINQNWLTHVIFYSLVPKSTYTPSDTFTSNALVYWKFAIYILTIICVYYTARLLGVNPMLAAAFACFALFTGRSYFDVRPAGFSNLLVAFYLLVLVLVTYRNILYIWLIVPLTVFWCNVHGGYLYVFLMLVPFVGLHILALLPKILAILLYNITAWPIFYMTLKRINWDMLRPEEIGPKKFALFFLFLVVAFIDVLLIVFKNKLVSIKRKGIYHAIGAAAVAFIAMIIFNPFHLTNLTHTFVISISKHAEMWRNVNEWHAGFEWMNPVGTSYPFFIMLILSITVPFFWFFSRVMKPRLLTAPKGQLDAQKSMFDIQIKIFGFMSAVIICWTTLLAFSFIDYDYVSFIICALFVIILLASIYRNIRFIYLMPLLVLFALWTAYPEGRGSLLWFTKIKTTYAGRYIYPFLILPAYMIMRTIASLFSKKIKTKPVYIVSVTVSAVVSLILMIFIFNPFRFRVPQWHFEEADSFLATVGAWFRSCFDWVWARFSALKYLKDTRVMWRPKFINNARPNYDHLFIFLYIVNILVICIWWFKPYLKKILSEIPENEGVDKSEDYDVFQLPKIDIALVAIAFLTIYMAVDMRRFIPIAAIAVCPLLALFVEQLVRCLSASLSFYKEGKLVVPQISNNLRSFFIIVSAAIVAYLGTYWTLKFKRIYLDAWPTDDKLTSVFMRMTASDAKPFYALKFIKDNKLEGKMFNYWTEGGFIAWGQQPDPNTGKTPLRLFMDGRAQAAYEPDIYKLWSYIMSGGPDVRSARVRGISIDYKQVGNWIDEQLRKYDVWVVLMPVAQFGSDFVKGLEANRNWLLVFFNNKQRLYVNRRHPQAQKLIEGISTGRTIYPNQFSKDLILSYYVLSSGSGDKKEGLELAIRACNAYPSRTPMEWINFAARFEDLKPRVIQFCRQYFDDFMQNMDKYKKQDSFHDRAFAAMIAGRYLGLIEKELKNDEKASFYASKVRGLEEDTKVIIESKRW